MNIETTRRRKPSNASFSRLVRRFAVVLAVIALGLAPTSNAFAVTHEIVVGDSLTSIAKKYGVSIASIKEKNKLETDVAKLGAKLQIPTKDEAQWLESRAAKRKEDAEKVAAVQKTIAERKALAEKRAAEETARRDAEKEAIAEKKAAEAEKRAQEKEEAAEKKAAEEEKRAEAEKKAEARKAKHDKDEEDADKSKKKKKGDDEDGEKSAKKGGPWVPEPPTQKTQTQKSADDRGVNPCNTDDPGFGVYERWNRASSMGQMLIPARGGITKDGGFDVVIHFHGHEAARKEWVKVMNGPVLVGITLGIGSGAYSSAFASPEKFKDLVASIEKEVGKQRGIENAHVRHLALSGWSAGYGAVGQILRQDYGKEMVDAVFLLDGLHTGYMSDGSLQRTELDTFEAFAKRAKAGKRLMYISHSSIIPPGYASTTETMRQLVHDLGGIPKKAKPRKGDVMGLELNERFDAGNFHMRGYDGNDKMDHCAHLGLLREVSKAYLKDRWKTPKGLGPKSEGKGDKAYGTSSKGDKNATTNKKKKKKRVAKTDDQG